MDIKNTPTATYNPAHDATQAQPDYYDFYALSQAFQGYGVQSGGVVTAHGTGLAVDVTAVDATSAGGSMADAAATNLTLATADPTNPRLDAVTVDPVGGITVTTGHAEANPSTPTIPANAVLLAVVTVTPSLSTLTNNNVIDKRLIVPIEVASSAPPITMMANLSLAADTQTLYRIPITIGSFQIVGGAGAVLVGV